MLKIFLLLTLFVVGIISVIVLLLLLWAPWPNWKKLPDPEIDHRDDVPKERVVGQIRVMTWNIGFASGEHGNPVHQYSKQEIQKNLDEIKKTVKSVSPDILFLQEVDRNSLRSADIDEYQDLMQDLGYKYGCFVTTWKCNYVPFPLTLAMERQLGRIHSGQAVFSKFPIKECRSIDLPELRDFVKVDPSLKWLKKHVNFLYRALSDLYGRYYIHRKVQQVVLDLDHGRTLPMLNCHLEAFGQEIREKQADEVARIASQTAAPLIVAGDMNSVPINAVQKNGFSDEAVDFSSDTTISRLLKNTELMDVLGGNNSDETTFTFPSYQPTRRLDYILEKGFGLLGECMVIQGAKGSDHLPIVVDLILL